MMKVVVVWSLRLVDFNSKDMLELFLIGQTCLTNWSDTYTISFINIRKSLMGKVDGVFFDEMVDLIDSFVEYPGTDEDYKTLITNHYSGK